MADSIYGTFTKDGITRDASSWDDFYRFKFDGWEQAEEPAVEPGETPAGNASLEMWQQYAAAQGVDVDGKTRDELRALFT